MPPKDPDAGGTVQISKAEFAKSSERKLRVHYSLPSPCSYSVGDTEVDERADAVVVTLHREPPADEGAICAEVVVEENTPVELSEPLGERPLVDGATGEVVKVH